jgi:hypothetical protein
MRALAKVPASAGTRGGAYLPLELGWEVEVEADMIVLSRQSIMYQLEDRRSATSKGGISDR